MFSQPLQRPLSFPMKDEGASQLQGVRLTSSDILQPPVRSRLCRRLGTFGDLADLS